MAVLIKKYLLEGENILEYTTEDLEEEILRAEYLSDMADMHNQYIADRFPR